MLDLSQLHQQIAIMAVDNHLTADHSQQRYEIALTQLELVSKHLADFRAKVARSRTSWLLADIHEPLTSSYGLPSLPSIMTVVATDGSQIAPSHHEVAPAFLVNISTVVLPYGTGERAHLTSQPTLFYREEDLYLDYGGQRVPVTGDLLGMRRTLMEFESLLQAAFMAQQDGRSVCALADGSLILWQLEGRPPAYQAIILQSYLACLERARQHGIPVLGYISRPRSRDVVNTLRVSLCPEQTPDSDRCAYERERQPPCTTILPMTDQLLFAAVLERGERTQIFGSASRILEAYQEHRVEFCYLHVGAEVVRLEMPRWVTTNPSLLALAHAVAFDQAQKGLGYPIALAEAHQHAVIRGSERELFYNMVTKAFLQRGVQTAISPKNLRKRQMTV